MKRYSADTSQPTPTLRICPKADRRAPSSTYQPKYFLKAYRVTPDANKASGNLMKAEKSFSNSMRNVPGRNQNPK
ncbi:MAG: hypothetical protein ACFNM7_07515 [Prevotella conceptionensis]